MRMESPQLIEWCSVVTILLMVGGIAFFAFCGQ